MPRFAVASANRRRPEAQCSAGLDRPRHLILVGNSRVESLPGNAPACLVYLKAFAEPRQSSNPGHEDLSALQEVACASDLRLTSVSLGLPDRKPHQSALVCCTEHLETLDSRPEAFAMGHLSLPRLHLEVGCLSSVTPDSPNGSAHSMRGHCPAKVGLNSIGSSAR